MKDKEKKLKDILIVQNISPIDRLEKSFLCKKLEYITKLDGKKGGIMRKKTKIKWKKRISICTGTTVTAVSTVFRKWEKYL